MHNNREVVIVSAVRTAIGAYGGAFVEVPATHLAGVVTQQAVERAGIDAENIEHCYFGNVIQSESADAYMARAAVLNAGLPDTIPALTVNRLCGSGLQAVVSASQSIQLGEMDCALAGGAENMSRGPYQLPNMRWGQRIGDTTAVDAVVAALHDPFGSGHMGCTAENLASKYAISREQQDEAAVESHRRATQAWSEGRFDSQIAQVTINKRKGDVVIERDEHFRADVTLEQMAKLRPAFQKNGTVTAGNASGLNDAAAALLLMERSAAEAQGLKPLARIVGYSYAAVPPEVMGIGPVPAIRSVMQQTGLNISDMDVIELNEAFAAQALAVIQELELPADKTNPNGSGISLGHPVGATGAIIMVKAVHELQRISGRYGLVSMCIGGGQGNAAIIERL